MQNETVNVALEVNSLTADAVNGLAADVKKTPDQIAAFLLRKGFSNLCATSNRKKPLSGRRF